MGTLAYAVRGQAPKAAPALQLVFALVLYLMVSLLLDLFPAGNATFFIEAIGGGAIGFFAINGLLGLDALYRLSERRLGRFAVRLGDASYSLYLSHWFLLSLIGKLGALWRDAPLGVVVLWQIGSIAGAVCFGLWFFETLEGPLHRFLKKKAQALTFSRSRLAAE